MKPKELAELGVPQDCMGTAVEAIQVAFKKRIYGSKAEVKTILRQVVSAPEVYKDEATFCNLANAIIASRQNAEQASKTWGNNPIGNPNGTYAQWGEKDDEGSMEQMKTACELPVAVQGALMPDNHLGYGLPIGGVLATHNSVIPFAVGVDIACRMKLSIFDLPKKMLKDVFAKEADPFVAALSGGTVFGVGKTQTLKTNHEVMDQDWNVCSTTRTLKDKAWSQLGTSGSGNHFVEFGLLTLDEPDLGLEPGTYVALLSHSGSRGVGAAVCKFYSDLAAAKLPKQYERFKNLAWLPLETEAGQEYWNAMNLMGDYAAANHAVIHKRVAQLIGGKVIAGVENHHNFAWEEEHDGNKLIVHRKGATPAGKGVLGVIPGSMADPAFVVRGRGKPESLLSASHGAGRQMSRTQAIKKFNWADWKSIIKGRGVRLLAAGLDEVPGVYKDIRKVMAAQTDLVNIVAQFDPKIVQMCGDGSKAED